MSIHKRRRCPDAPPATRESPRNCLQIATRRNTCLDWSSNITNHTPDKEGGVCDECWIKATRNRPVTPANKRRWFAYSLRSLFVVVTIFGIWLGWNANTVGRRLSIRHNLEARGVEIQPGYGVGGADGLIRPPDRSDADLPWIREALGDEAIAGITFPSDPDPEDLANTNYSPEAFIIRQTDEHPWRPPVAPNSHSDRTIHIPAGPYIDQHAK